MKMRNTSEHTMRIRADLIDDGAWMNPTEARPFRVEVPPGAVVEVRDEYAVRRRSAHADIDPDTGAIAPGAVIPSVISEQTADAMRPADATAQEFYERHFHDSLPSVIAHVEELRRKEAAERGEVPSFGKARVRLS